MRAAPVNLPRLRIDHALFQWVGYVPHSNKLLYFCNDEKIRSTCGLVDL